MKRVIYSNYDLYDNYEDAKQFLMEEYPELCACEVTHKDGSITMEPSDEQIWNEIYAQDEFNWDDTWTALKQFFKNETVLMFGSIGRWDGTFAGGKIGEFEDLFRDITSDCDYIEFVDDNGHFYINCSHHDGTNSVECRILSDKGRIFADNWEYGYGDKRYNIPDSELHRRIAVNNVLSKLPHYCRKEWGCKNC